MVSLEKRRSGNESLLAIWFLRTMSYKQTRLAPVCYKDSGLKVLFTFQVWARLFYRCMYFFVFVFSYLLYGCVPCHTERYQTHSTSKIRTLFWLHKLATYNLHLATKILQLVAKRRPNDLFNFEPWSIVRQKYCHLHIFQSGMRIWTAIVGQCEIEVFNPQAWDSSLMRESWQVHRDRFNSKFEQ